MDQHFIKSSFREKLIEHIFIGELLKLSWLNKDCSLEIAKPEVDNQGYDLIVEQSGIIRHVQLKTSHRTARASAQKVHVGLSKKPAGCVVWVQFDEATLELGPFLYFGDNAAGPLPSLSGMKVAKHTKANASGHKAERPDIRQVPKSRFDVYETIQDLSAALFLRN